MAKTVLVLIVLVMFSIGLFIVSKVGVFLKESKKEDRKSTRLNSSH